MKEREDVGTEIVTFLVIAVISGCLGSQSGSQVLPPPSAKEDSDPQDAHQALYCLQCISSKFKDGNIEIAAKWSCIKPIEPGEMPLLFCWRSGDEGYEREDEKV